MYLAVVQCAAARYLSPLQRPPQLTLHSITSSARNPGGILEAAPTQSPVRALEDLLSVTARKVARIKRLQNDAELGHSPGEVLRGRALQLKHNTVHPYPQGPVSAETSPHRRAKTPLTERLEALESVFQESQGVHAPASSFALEGPFGAELKSEPQAAQHGEALESCAVSSFADGAARPNNG